MTTSKMKRPSVLYRYRPFDSPRVPRELKSITDSYIWCSNYKAMNDAMEGYYDAQLEADEGKLSWATRYIFNQKMAIGLASFSETHDNELMWAHYAGNYSGICVEYQYDMLSEKLAADERSSLSPIEYHSRMLVVRKKDLDDTLEVARRILLRKKRSWSYEKEWRLLTSRGRHDIIPGTVSRIFIGARMRPYERKDLIEGVSRKFPEIEFFDMRLKGYKHYWDKVEIPA